MYFAATEQLLELGLQQDGKRGEQQSDTQSGGHDAFESCQIEQVLDLGELLFRGVGLRVRATTAQAMSRPARSTALDTGVLRSPACPATVHHCCQVGRLNVPNQQSALSLPALSSRFPHRR